MDDAQNRGDSPAVSPLDRIVLITERELATIEERTDAEVRELSGRADRRVRETALDRRRQLDLVRAELIDRITALAIRFEGMLEQLDSADAELERLVGEGKGGLTIEEGGAEERVRAGERKRVSFRAAPGPPPPPGPPPQSPAAEPGDAQPSEPQARPRWWHRFRRGGA